MTDIIGRPDPDPARSRHWRRYAVAGGVFALAGIIVAASLSAIGHSPTARRPGGVIPALPPPAPGPAPSQTWVTALSIANWPMPGSGDSNMFAGGVAANTGWELTLQNLARPGQRCAAAVVLSQPGPHGQQVTDVYPVSPHPASRTPVGDLTFITLGAKAPGVGVGFLQLGTPAQQISADPSRIGGFEISVPVLTLRACGQRYYLAGFAYPLAGTLDLSVSRNSGNPVHYLVPTRLSRPRRA